MLSNSGNTNTDYKLQIDDEKDNNRTPLSNGKHSNANKRIVNNSANNSRSFGKKNKYKFEMLKTDRELFKDDEDTLELIDAIQENYEEYKLLTSNNTWYQSKYYQFAQTAFNFALLLVVAIEMGKFNSVDSALEQSLSGRSVVRNNVTQPATDEMIAGRKQAVIGSYAYDLVVPSIVMFAIYLVKNGIDNYAQHQELNRSTQIKHLEGELDAQYSDLDARRHKLDRKLTYQAPHASVTRIKQQETTSQPLPPPISSTAILNTKLTSPNNNINKPVIKAPKAKSAVATPADDKHDSRANNVVTKLKESIFENPDRQRGATFVTHEMIAGRALKIPPFVTNLKITANDSESEQSRKQAINDANLKETGPLFSLFLTYYKIDSEKLKNSKEEKDKFFYNISLAMNGIEGAGIYDLTRQDICNVLVLLNTAAAYYGNNLELAAIGLANSEDQHPKAELANIAKQFEGMPATGTVERAAFSNALNEKLANDKNMQAVKNRINQNIQAAANKSINTSSTTLSY